MAEEQSKKRKRKPSVHIEVTTPKGEALDATLLAALEKKMMHRLAYGGVPEKPTEPKKRKPPATAEVLQAQERRISEVDYKLVAECLHQQVEDLNRALELAYTLGINIRLIDINKNDDSGHGYMIGPFGPMFGFHGSHGRKRRCYPQVQLLLSKTEKL